MGMQQDEFDALTTRSAQTLEETEELLSRKLRAQDVIRTELEAMRSEDKILMLTDEEERLLRAFRAFKLRTKPGGVFRWQTRPDSEVVIAQETGLVQDPCEVIQE